MNSNYFFLLVQGVSQPLSAPYLPEPALAVHAAAHLSPSAENDYVTSMLAAWGQLIMDDLISTANGNKVSVPTFMSTEKKHTYILAYMARCVNVDESK